MITPKGYDLVLINRQFPESGFGLLFIPKKGYYMETAETPQQKIPTCFELVPELTPSEGHEYARDMHVRTLPDGHKTQITGYIPACIWPGLSNLVQPGYALRSLILPGHHKDAFFRRPVDMVISEAEYHQGTRQQPGPVEGEDTFRVTPLGSRSEPEPLTPDAAPLAAPDDVTSTGSLFPDMDPAEGTQGANTSTSDEFYDIDDAPDPDQTELEFRVYDPQEPERSGFKFEDPDWASEFINHAANGEEGGAKKPGHPRHDLLWMITILEQQYAPNIRGYTPEQAFDIGIKAAVSLITENPEWLRSMVDEYNHKNAASASGPSDYRPMRIIGAFQHTRNVANEATVKLLEQHQHAIQAMLKDGKNSVRNMGFEIATRELLSQGIIEGHNDPDFYTDLAARKAAFIHDTGVNDFLARELRLIEAILSGEDVNNLYSELATLTCRMEELFGMGDSEDFKKFISSMFN